ncbi:hypothetical protein CAEBREN_05080 [Caenorhabditis brenneri]|uniref:Uncharacterized protein n=1 Tax=Caenorhabditis brenneri TaxID=135651 RepID=G0NKC3_CAEBE|nr:hypothetical protein CAEBREN_05080 [Caenorhabditis brenneri]
MKKFEKLNTENSDNVPIDLTVDPSQLEIALVKELAENRKDMWKQFESRKTSTKVCTWLRNIFNDAMHTVDLMDEDRYKILTTHMENRRTLKLM